jgi:hypothetical protein
MSTLLESSLHFSSAEDGTTVFNIARIQESLHSIDTDSVDITNHYAQIITNFTKQKDHLHRKCIPQVPEDHFKRAMRSLESKITKKEKEAKEVEQLEQKLGRDETQLKMAEDKLRRRIKRVERTVIQAEDHVLYGLHTLI